MAEKDLSAVLDRIAFPDDAKVIQQLTDQQARVRARMARVRLKVFVMSGKGGVGKSSTTVQLALAFARRGLSVGILDADLNGPSVPRMLGLDGRPWRLGPDGAEPEVGPLGVRVASAEFFLKPGEPFRWRGPKDLTQVWLGTLESGTMRELVSDVNWGPLDLLLFDLPPGAASDKPPALLQLVPDLAGAVVVTTPSEVARSVVRRSEAYARDLGIRLLGTIENMSGYRCRCCRQVGPLFPDGGAAAEGVLGKVPFDPDLSESLDAGRPLPADHPASVLFDGVAATLAARLEEPS